MNGHLTFSTTLTSDIVRIGVAVCVVVRKSAREGRLIVRRTTGTRDEQRCRHATARQYDAARPVLLVGKGKR